jgi:phosphocarrier protein
LRRTVQITNPIGFHLRPKMAFAKLAERFESSVRVIWEGRAGDGKSMWDLMLVSAPQGSEVTIEVSGPDAAAAIDALAAVLASPSTDENPEPDLGAEI